jgi:AcrR family transcriptional regulator
MSGDNLARESDGSQAAPAPPRRMRPSDRQAEIVRAARGVFLSTGYGGAGLAEVAAAGEVSRGSIYRYFPNGRTDLFIGVTEDLLAELHGRLRYAASVPFSPAKRLEHLIGAMFAFFQEEPNAYRFLFRDVWAAGDPSVEAAASATRSLLTAEIAGVIADSDLDADELAASSAGILGFALANIELSLSSEVDAETAWEVTCRFATSQINA